MSLLIGLRLASILLLVVANTLVHALPLLLVGLNPIPGEQAWRQAWRGIWPRLAERHGAVLLPSLYAPIAALPKADHRSYLLADGVHPNAAGIRLMAAALGPKVQEMLG